MPDLNKIIEDLSSLTVAEAAELSKQLEEKWGVTPMAAAAPAAAAAAAEEDKDDFSIEIDEEDDDNIEDHKKINGAIAQLGERYTGSVEVRGSNPLSSTITSGVL